MYLFLFKLHMGSFRILEKRKKKLLLISYEFYDFIRIY